MRHKTERRTSTRCIANCQCWIEQESVTLFGTVTNLSSTGLFLQTLPIIETGTEIDIRLSLQDVGDLLAKGRVAWKSNSLSQGETEDRTSSVPGLGIVFSSIKKGKEHLPEYIAKRSIIPQPPEKKL